MKPVAALVHLGCAKNLVDSETIVPQLLELGYVMSDDPAAASLVVVNTCGFLESAVEEAIDTVLRCTRYKSAGSCGCLVVAGCMVQRYGKKLLALLPEVDLLVGTSHYREVGSIVRGWRQGERRRLWIARPRDMQHSDTPRLRSMPRHSAYLKIADGCSNHCSFCLIPRLRGPLRSRSVADIVSEALCLAAEGVKEINLIAQDITAYGWDRGDRNGLPQLLEALENVPGLQWVRLLYAYPGHIGTPLLQAMAQSRKIVPYLDFPIQHCVPRILATMHRGVKCPEPERLIEGIRAHLPEVALRTTIMVGFPGETETDFHELLRFVEQAQFDHLGVFAFSPEAGTAAAKLPRQVPGRVKARRRKQLLAVQREVSRHRLRRFVGRTVPVLVEGFHPESELLLAGRMPFQAPEVDGLTIITRGQASVGEISPVHITAVGDYDVIGELAGSDQD
jgi:ribosomal protein S12 methylthiotransferase